MSKTLKNSFFLYLIIFLVLISLATPVTAFSLDFNPISFLRKTTDIIISRTSDIIYYLVMQKKYIFDHYQDPNVYISPKIPENILNITASTTAAGTANVYSGNLVVVTTSTISTSSLNESNRVPVQTAVPPVPGLIVRSFSVEPPRDEEILIYNTSSILAYTNKERTKKGLAPLSSDSNLDYIAGQRADDLFANQYFEHESPDGKSATDIAKEVGYDYLLIGENLALGDFGDDQGIVSAWMDSPGHRANILNDKYKKLGVAVKTGVYNGQNTTIAVQIFALPMAACPKPDSATKALIDSSALSIQEMQAEAQTMYNRLLAIKNDPQIDRSYYNQKIQEYNYYAKKVNDAVLFIKNIIDSYNSQVAQYNTCANSF